MSVAARALIESKFAADVANSEYTAAAGTRTIIDKFTATNTDGSSRTLTVYLVPNAGVIGTSNLIISVLSIASGATVNIPELQNQVLNSGDSIAVLASLASVVVIRVSGREIT